MDRLLLQKFCDLQVHSPRDHKYQAWPEGLMTLEGLYTWAEKLLDECRKRKVHVIAVTDHHDLLAGLITLEVCRRLNFEDVWVFPGMEITSKTGLQAVLLLDPGVVGSGPFAAIDVLPLQGKVNAVIGQSILAPATPARALEEPSWAELERLKETPERERAARFRPSRIDRVDRDFDGEEGIVRNLERQFADNFVLLPNLEKNKQGVFGNESGRSLYVTAGGWFVGGIVSGGNEPNHDVICGRNPNDYGSRVVTCLRSSDQRGKSGEEWFADHFGTERNGSWMKLSEPTTVSITQALISGPERRVFNSVQTVPADRIDHLWVEGAAIFGEKRVELPFSPHLNSLVGGRGSGKSLLLSAVVRLFGMDHDWIGRKFEEDEERPIWEERHKSLFSEGGPFGEDGVILGAEYEKAPGVHYRVVLTSPRLGSSSKWELSIRGAEGWELVSSSVGVPDALDFRPLAFLQGQMSALTGRDVDQDDLRRLIEGPIRQKRAELRSRLENLAAVVTEGAENGIRLRQFKAQVEPLRAQVRQKEEERKRYLTLAQAGLSEEERRLFSLADPVKEMVNAANNLKTQLDSVLRELDATRNETSASMEQVTIAKNALVALGEAGLGGHSYIETLLSGSKSIIEELGALRRKGERLLGESAKSEQDFSRVASEVLARAKAFGEQERTRREAASSADALLTSINEAKAQIEKITRETGRIEKSELIAAGIEALEEFKVLVRGYSAELSQRAEEISKDEELRLYVQLIPGGNYASFLEGMKTLCEGAGVRGSTWAKVEEAFKSSRTPAQIMSALIETMIGVLSNPESPSLPEIWKNCGFTDTVFRNVVSKTSVESWMGLSVVLAEDNVDVRYRVPGGAPIPILKASPGERAVELLKLALRSTTGPLVVDQPEDDLDNSFLAEMLVKLVHEAKPRNQLIFASHNANLVVHGDSDVIHVMQTVSGEGETGRCERKAGGTIDQKDVCLDVERIMEGGRRAFEERRRKYHETVDPSRQV